MPLRSGATVSKSGEEPGRAAPASRRAMNPETARIMALILPRSETDAHRELAGARQALSPAAVDAAEAGLRDARGVDALGRQGVAGFGVEEPDAVEYVEELDPDLQARSLAEAGELAEGHVLARVARGPVVGLVDAGHTEGAGRSIGPGLRVENEVSVRVDAAAVQVLREERLARHPVGVGAPEDQGAEVVLGVRYQDRLAARVAED